ncbi:hypothetical protein ABIB62_002541 [Mucilaginibacter sp. UYP25]
MRNSSFQPLLVLSPTSRHAFALSIGYKHERY